MAPRQPSTVEPQPRSSVKQNRSSYLTRRVGGPLYLLFGTPTRLILALLLIAGCAKWRYDNRDEIITELEQTQGRRIDPTEQDPTKAIDMRMDIERREHITQDAQIPMVPQTLCQAVSSWNAGLAGLLLILSVFFPAISTAFVVILAAALMVFGDRWEFIANLPLGSPKSAALITGGILGVIGLAVGRKLG